MFKIITDYFSSNSSVSRDEVLPTLPSTTPSTTSAITTTTVTTTTHPTSKPVQGKVAYVSHEQS